MNLFDNDGVGRTRTGKSDDKEDKALMGLVITYVSVGIFAGYVSNSGGMALAAFFLCIIGFHFVPIKTRNTFGYLLLMGILLLITLSVIIGLW